MTWAVTYRCRSICLPNPLGICNCNSCHLSSRRTDPCGSDDLCTGRMNSILTSWACSSNKGKLGHKREWSNSLVVPYIALRLGGAVFDFTLCIILFQIAGFGFHHFGDDVLRFGVGATRNDSVLLRGSLGIVRQLAVDPEFCCTRRWTS